MSAFGEGAPCWADASLPDLEAGQRFYGELFGWTFQDQGEEYGHYVMARRDGKDAAALMGKPDPTMPTAWSVYLAAADAGRTVAAIREAGGRVVVGPDTVGGFGVMAGAVDPGGSFFGVWQGQGHDGFGAVGEPGAFCWTENHTRDTPAVDAFYAAVFGFETARIGDGAAFDYVTWSVPGGGDPVMGRMGHRDGLPAGAPPAFQVYFAVADCDTALDTVRRLGGQVLSGPDDTPFGRMATVADDQGARFAVIDTTRTTGPIPGR